MAKRYNWFPEKVFPMESQWSLLHKFLIWNSLRVRSLHKAIGKKAYTNSNLSRGKFFSINKFINATGMDKENVKNSLPQTYLPGEIENALYYARLSLLIFQTLRFCPECIKSGYHSCLYQLMLFKYCPIHYLELQIQCPYCFSLISMDASGRNFKNAYGCPICKTCFCEIDDIRNIGLGKFQIERIERAGEILLNCLNRGKKCSVFYSDSYYELPRKKKSGNCILQIWTDLFPSNIITTESNDLNHYVVKRRRTENASESDHLKIIAIYKSIRRHIFKVYIRPHKKCYQAIKKIGAVYSGFSCNGSIFCPDVHGYIIWRMYWEGQLNIYWLDKKANNFDIKWEKSDLLNTDESMRIFSIECLQSFFHFLIDAHTYEKKNLFKLPDLKTTDNITSFVVCWAIKDKQQENNIYIHSWTNCKTCPFVQPFSNQHFKRVHDGICDIEKKLQTSRW